MNHSFVERNLWLLITLTLVVVCIGGAIELLPMVFNATRTQALEGVRPYTALELEGRDIYIREGCHVCHTQMVRRLHEETLRYGPYSVAGEDVYERPFLWGSKRTGPDLARVGGRYSDAWHRAHLYDPRSVVPASNMPAYPWLFENRLDGDDTPAKMRVLRRLGVPYTDADIESATAAVAGHTESEALILYLQSLGTERTAAGASRGPSS